MNDLFSRSRFLLLGLLRFISLRGRLSGSFF
jgi:hypothetical protein